eukprot:1136894-Pelagomonas_calceolata.AAC.6
MCILQWHRPKQNTKYKHPQRLCECNGNGTIPNKDVQVPKSRISGCILQWDSYKQRCMGGLFSSGSNPEAAQLYFRVHSQAMFVQKYNGDK